MTAAPTSEQHFVAFVREQTDPLLKTAYLLTRNGPDAEELVQDSLVWLFPRWTQVQAADHQLAYVRKCLVNRFIAGKRKMASSEIRFGDELDVLLPEPSRLDETGAVDDRDLMWRELGILPQRQRAALVLRFFHDLPDAEVAEVLGCRVGTVRSLISRGLGALRLTGTFADDATGSYYLRNVR